MTVRTAGRMALLALTTATALVVGGGVAPASATPVLGPTRIVSAGTDGAPAGAAFQPPAISSNGRYVAFVGPGTLLPGAVQPALDDVYLRDTVGGTVERISVDDTGAQLPGTWNGSAPTVSDDGRFVVFSGMPTAGQQSFEELFIRDRQLGTTTRVTATSARIPVFGIHPLLTRNGRYLVFTSFSAELGPNPNAWGTVYRLDLRTGSARRVSETRGGFIGNNQSRATSVSENGRYVGLVTSATNLVPGLNPIEHFMVKDLVTKEVLFPNRTAAGLPNTEPEFAGSVSGDGTTVVFLSTGTDVGGPTPGPAGRRLFVAPLRPGPPVVTTSVPVGDPFVASTSISRDGHRIAFTSGASLVKADTNTITDAYVADVGDPTPTLATVSSGGRPGRGVTYQVALAASGRTLAFLTAASNLVPNDVDVRPDVMIRRLG